MKKTRLIITLFLSIFLVISIAGCNKKTVSDNTDIGTDAGDISREEYIGMLCDQFGLTLEDKADAVFSDVKSDSKYYDAIQACSVWEVIQDTDKFNPNDKASLGFALESAVRAIGMNKLPDCGNTTKEIADYYTANIAQIDISDLDAPVDYETANAVIEYAVEYQGVMSIPQSHELTMAEGTKEGKPEDFQFSINGKTGLFNNGAEANYAVGDIIYVPPTDSSSARGIKIAEINGNEFVYTVPETQEVLGGVQVSGTYEGNIVDITLPTESNADDQVLAMYGDNPYISTIDAVNGRQFDSLYYYPAQDDYTFANVDSKKSSKAGNVKITPDIAKDKVLYSLSWTDNGNSVNATVGIKNIKINTIYEDKWQWGWPPYVIKEAGVTVDFDTVAKCDAKGSTGTEIPLGDVTVNVWGPLDVNIKLTAHIGLDGELTVDYSSHVTATAKYVRGKGLSNSAEVKKQKLTYEAHVTITATLTAFVDARILGGSVVNAEVTSGVVAIITAEGDILDDSVPNCIDVYIYVPLEFGVNQKGCLITNINGDLKYYKKLWTSKNSPITWRMHWEDGVKVDKCTRGQKEKVEADSVDEKGEPIDEYALFDFKPLEYEKITVQSYTVFTNPGENTEILFDKLPEGVSASDLVYTIENKDVCSVESGGKVIGKNGGSTIVIITTPDGMYRATVSVTVNTDYNSDFKEL